MESSDMLLLHVGHFRSNAYQDRAFVFVLRGARNQGGIHFGASHEQHVLFAQQSIDGGQHLIDQLVFFQPVMKPEDGALIWQAIKRVKLRKLAVARGVEKGFFHRRA